MNHRGNQPRFESSDDAQLRQPPFSPPARNAQDSINRLIQVVTRLKVNNNPEVAERVRKIAIKGDVRAAEKLLRLLSKHYYKDLLDPEPFLSAEQNLAGDLLLGYENANAVGLDFPHINRHTLIVSGSGFGKSTLAKNIFVQLAEKGIPVWYIDRKQDMIWLARNGVDVFTHAEWRDNWLQPVSPQADIHEHLSSFTKAFAELFAFMARGLSILIKAVHLLYTRFGCYEWYTWDWSKPFPCIIDLLEYLKSDEITRECKGQARESLFSLIDKLEAVAIELNPITSCRRGFDIGELIESRRPVVLDLSPVTVDYQNLVILMLLIKATHYLRLRGMRNQLQLVIMFDEAKGIIGRQMQNNLVLKDTISKCREWGLGLCMMEQVASEVAQAAWSNVANVLMGRCSDGVDLQRLRYSMGMTKPEEMLFNYTLKPGRFLLRSAKFKDIHVIDVPFEEVKKHVPPEELQQLMAPRLAELNKDVIPYVKAGEGSKDNKEKKKETDSLNGVERHFLEYLARNFDKPSSQIYQELGLRNSEGFRFKEKLREKKCISQVTTNLGRDGKKAVFLVPNRMVFEELGVELGSGRGGVLHKHFQAGLKARAEQLAFIAKVDESVDGTPEAPDVGIEKDRTRIAVEICVTSKPSTEVLNIEKNFRLGFDGVILTFVNRQVLEKTKDLALARYPQDVLQKVKFCLVNEFSSIFGES